jgi:wyosine [tRNA(Phe)-imidazoG37] synthetase (radical SAM superfamily)
MTTRTGRKRSGFDPKKAASVHGSVATNAARKRTHPAKRYLFQRGVVYGPVQTRRLGFSIGMNLLPSSYKLCSFDCVYCQYAWTKNVSLAPPEELLELPRVEDVVTALSQTLEHLQNGRKVIDAITVCGNGEPTLYPNLYDLAARLKHLRDVYQPQATLAILSNSSTLGEAAVRDAMDLFDAKIMKFDAGREEMFEQLNHPRAPVYMGEIVAGLKALRNVHLQCLFVQGRVTNADPDSVALWLERVRDIKPLSVQVCTLEREPPDKKIESVNVTTLQWIADQVRWRTGVPAEVF